MKYSKCAMGGMSGTGSKIKVGDTVGNTVQGFNFKVLAIKSDRLLVRNKNTGYEFETYIENMYKRKGE